MFLLVKKIVKTLKGETNFDILQPLVFGDFVVKIQENQKLFLTYKNREIIKNLWFQASHFNLDNKSHKVKKISNFDINFNFQKGTRKLFMMFEQKNPFFELRGSIVLTFKNDQIICEQRYFTNAKIHARITSFMEFEKSFDTLATYQSLKSDLHLTKITLESTQNNWTKNNNVITNSAFVEETKKSNKELIVKHNNKGYQTLKINIGDINE